MLSNITPIYDITPMTMLDYPDNLACIVWLTGCSLRCSYCYNPSIVRAGKGKYTEEDLFKLLKRRRGLLDGVVLSGGECTDYHRIVGLCEKIKTMGFLIKIDTNGSNPDVIAELFERNLIDYVALDYKAPRHRFREVTGTGEYDHFCQSLNLLLKSDIKYEVRTTVHTDLIDECDINSIIDDLHRRGYKGHYYLQHFREGTDTLGNLTKPSRKIDASRLSDKITLSLRS